jgi:fructokinase
MRAEIVSFGVMILDMFPVQLGVDIAHVKEFRPMPGGSCANVAVAAAKLGIKSSFVGKVGNDCFGKMLLEKLNHYGVNTEQLVQDDEFRTTMNFHAKPQPEEIEYLFYRNPGADANLKLKDIDMTKIKKAGFFHFDSLCLTVEPIKNTTMEVLKILKDSDICISFDFNYRSILWESPDLAIEAINEVLPYIDIFKMNEAEYELLCKNTVMKTGLRKIIEGNPSICIVTKGHKGSLIMNATYSVETSAKKVEVVDTIGCGDAFIAGFLSGLCIHEINYNKISLEQLEWLALFADATAALNATKKGAMPALPTLEEVLKLIDSY